MSEQNLHQRVNHDLAHPDVHYASGPWSEAQTLHVAAAYSNPLRWETRRRLFNDFRRHMADSPNVQLHVGELAYGDRPFEVTNQAHPLDCQFRTTTELWHKENVLNLTIARFPTDWRYGAYCDGDFHFTRRDWALEAVHLLQHFDWVQLFSSYTHLDAAHRPLAVLPGLIHNWTERRGNPARGYMLGGSPGGAWAFRRSAFETCGGLLDVCILGSGDWYMACGLTKTPVSRQEDTTCSPAYRQAITAWQRRAASLRHNIGYVPGHAVHYFHGSYASRAYGSRWQLLRDYQFDPAVNIFRDWQGVYQLSPQKTGLRDALRRYFISRNEDDPCLNGPERPMV